MSKKEPLKAVFVSETLHQKIKEEAVKNKRSMAEEMTIILEEYYNK